MLIGVVLWMVLFLARYYGHRNTGSLAYVVELMGMNWLGILFVLFLNFLLVDLLTAFGFLFPTVSIHLRTAALITGIMLSLFALFQGSRLPVFEDYEISIPDLPKDLDGKVLVAVSDLHIGTLRGNTWLQKCVNRIQSRSPDMILLLGDVFEGHGTPEKEVFTTLGKLSAPLGVYGVLGNHEFHGEENILTELMEQDGIRVLRNQWVSVSPGLVVAGVDDLRSYERRVKSDVNLIARAMQNIPPDAAVILLSHRPVQAEKAANLGVDLMLSGHTHGGQIWPFGYVTRRYFPLLAGEYRIKEMAVVVCRGTGGWGPSMRLWKPGEISCITLRKR